jgi:hypothetical protein
LVGIDFDYKDFDDSNVSGDDCETLVDTVLCHQTPIKMLQLSKKKGGGYIINSIFTLNHTYSSIHTTVSSRAA